MPLATSITLPEGTKPVFPDKCVVCHSKPDDKIHIAQSSANWLLSFFLPILLLFGWSRVEIPICRTCKGRFRFQRWGRELILWTLIGIAIWYIMPRFAGWPSFTRKIVVGALALLAVSPSLIADAFWPRIFDTKAQDGKVDYDFADADYAAEFFELNNKHVIISDTDVEPHG